MIRDQRGFITGIIASVLAIVCIVVFIITDEKRYVMAFLIMLAYAAISFVRAFSKKGLIEEITGTLDERDIYVTMKTGNLVIKIMNYTIFALTLIALLIYSAMEQLFWKTFWMTVAGTLCSVLVLTVIVYLIVNSYMEKHE